MKFNNPSELISQEDLEKINNSIIGKPFTIKFNKRCSTIAAFIEDEYDNVCENCLFHEFCKKNSFKMPRISKENALLFATILGVIIGIALGLALRDPDAKWSKVGQIYDHFEQK